jgi:uncharacterized protein (DUF488 family)
MTRKPKIYTIGYEDMTVARFTKKLRDAGIKTLVDVRAVPLSRKPGFSKNVLAANLKEGGIDYVSLKGLGTPADGRDAARKGKLVLMRKIFEKHMKTKEARLDLGRAIEISLSHRACLLCFEADPGRCHRAIVAEKMQSKTGQDIEHLYAGLDFLL